MPSFRAVEVALRALFGLHGPLASFKSVPRAILNDMAEWWTTAAVSVLGLAFLWLVVAKPVTRTCRSLGVDTPCPYWLGWILVLRPGRWRKKAILDRVGLRPGESALEIGCGVGVFTSQAARYLEPGGHLQIVDAQPAMIEHTRRRLDRDQVRNAELQVGDARALPFGDASFDRVYLISALYELTDPKPALAEVRRVLKPGGILSVTDEFFDPEFRFPAETRRVVERCGFTLANSHGSWWMHTLNFVPA